MNSSTLIYQKRLMVDRWPNRNHSGHRRNISLGLVDNNSKLHRSTKLKQKSNSHKVPIDLLSSTQGTNRIIVLNNKMNLKIKLMYLRGKHNIIILLTQSSPGRLLSNMEIISILRDQSKYWSSSNMSHNKRLSISLPINNKTFLLFNKRISKNQNPTQTPTNLRVNLLTLGLNQNLLSVSHLIPLIMVVVKKHLNLINKTSSTQIDKLDQVYLFDIYLQMYKKSIINKYQFAILTTGHAKSFD